MPHVELKYSNDLCVDAKAILETIETTINAHDSGAGVCKGRAYPAIEFNHSHVYISIVVLPKSHRDAQFMQALLDELEAVIIPLLPKDCYHSINLAFVEGYYMTN